MIYGLHRAVMALCKCRCRTAGGQCKRNYEKFTGRHASDHQTPPLCRSRSPKNWARYIQLLQYTVRRMRGEIRWSRACDEFESKSRARGSRSPLTGLNRGVAASSGRERYASQPEEAIGQRSSADEQLLATFGRLFA